MHLKKTITGPVAFLLLICCSFSYAVTYPDCYNVKWASQSSKSSESMPLGGGDIGLVVWVEDGDLMFYLSQSGSFDENNSFLKLGRIRLNTTPNILDNPSSFSQELVLKDGCVSIHAAENGQTLDIELWVDVFRSVIHAEINSSDGLTTNVQYESWRMADRDVPLDQRHQCFSYTGYLGDVTTYKDIVSFDGNAINWYHRNRDDKLLFDFCVNQQGLGDVKSKMWNPQKGLTFGGTVKGNNMVSDGTVTGTYAGTGYTAWRLKSQSPTTHQKVDIYLHTKQTDTLTQWQNSLQNIIADSEANAENAKQQTRNWWIDFWNRSHIMIKPENTNPSDIAWQIGRNYQLFRYLLGCNAYGQYPSKFNGGLFTFDPVYVNSKYPFTPDFRLWGGGSFTAQNQRLVYWPMLKSGDFDMMKPQFEYYKRPLKNAELRSQVYWGHEGACFIEQLENFGLPIAGGWGFPSASYGLRVRPSSTPFGELPNKYIRYHYVNQLEFVLMILDYYQYAGNDISGYMPLIQSCIKFFDQHYQYRLSRTSGLPLDENGKLVLYPSAAGESYNICKNPTDLISALTTVLARLQELEVPLVTEADKLYWNQVAGRIPSLTNIQYNGYTVISPAQQYGVDQNDDIPELYSVFPYGLYGLGRPDLQLAIDTYNYGVSVPHKWFDYSWSQAGIFSARLGLINESKDRLINKLGNANRRFPAFWGPGKDYLPDHNHGGSGMIHLQEKIVQTDGRKIYLLPTWPADWNVDFKLHAPYETIIEGKYKEGKFIDLMVTPQSRRNDVIIKPEYAGHPFDVNVNGVIDLPDFAAFAEAWLTDVLLTESVIY